MKHLSAILLFVIALTTTAEAQQAQGGGAKVWTELFAGSSTAVVKGAPFSAEAISESVQMLADGNKISRSNTTRMFRDGEGRFRREGNSSIGSGGGNVAAYYYGTGFNFGFQDTISIFDPVGNVRYSLNPSAKTARRMNSPQFKVAEGGAVIVNGQLSTITKAQIEAGNAAKKTEVVVSPYLAAISQGSGSAGKTESLGTREFEGVAAEGTRTVTTIAAGAIGNERAIETVYERWYSKELQLIVYSKHTDPRFGEQTYRLTNINRSEPDRSLFAPPADYKIVTETGFNYFTTKPQ